MKIIYYFCTVKSYERHEVAAWSSVFCAINFLLKYSRLECGTSNGHKVTARMNLTTPSAFCLMSN